MHKIKQFSNLAEQQYSKLVLGKRFRKLHSLNQDETHVHLETSEYVKHYKKGDNVLGFLVKEVTEVPELHLTAVRLQHVMTGADHLHIARNDTNNVFAVAFRTPPPDSSGVCHILEHLALCGSKTYPCRDPFFKMLNRSLSTFMNAFTGSDFTMYPFSSQNFHDFQNLMNVYLDAAFFPLLREMDFSQEGWRMEHEDLENPSSPIIFKGIVFNEMKGVFASPAYHFQENQLNKLLPSHAYRFVSGGDPLHIPKLTWQKLKDYHSVYYHPSNARFFTYGTFPLEFHLSNLNSWVMSNFSKIDQKSSIPLEPKWSEPRESDIKCPPDPMSPNPEKQTTVSLSYLLNNITDTHESFTMAVISNLLMDGANSPFYKSLLMSGTGADYSPGAGFNGNNSQGIFSIGLTGISDRDVETVKSTIEQTFEAVVKEGFPQERIEAVLHLVELGNKHQTENFGLSIAMAVNANWNHGGDPIRSLKINKHVAWFIEQLKKDSLYLQNKVVEYFQHNSHRLCLVMKPEDDFTKQGADKENEILQQKLRDLTKDDKDNIFLEGKKLAKFQNEPVDSSCLPTLLIAEVSPTIELSNGKRGKFENVPLYSFCQPTNGIVYFRSVLNTSKLSDDLQPYLPLFCNIVSQMGAGGRDYLKQDQEISLRTGGLSGSIHISEHSSEYNNVEQGILLNSHCLEHNAQHMFALWSDIFQNLLLSDEERLAQLIRIDASDLAQNLPFHGHVYAMRRANSRLNASSALQELFSGVTHISLLKKLAELDNYSDVVVKLKEIAHHVLNKNTMRCALHMTPAFESEATYHITNFLSSIPGSGSGNEFLFNQKTSPYEAQSTHIVMPFPVNYVAKGYPTVPYVHPDFASLRILSKLVSSKYLHREIREIGGAYGSGASLNHSGIWTFYSYRDPNTQSTLNTFSSSIDWLVEAKFTEQDIHEAKLGIFSEVDKPIAPGNKGLPFFLNGIDDQQRQKHKDNLFLVSKTLLQDCAKKYLLKNKQYGVAILGPENVFTTDRNWKILSEDS